MDQPFDRVNVGLRERPNSGDINGSEGSIYRTIQELVRFAFGARNADNSSALKSLSGFLGDGLRVVPSNPAAQSVVVSSGMGFLYSPSDLPTNIGAPDLVSVNDLAVLKPAFLMSPVTFAVPTGPAGPNTRIDIIEVCVGRRLENSIVRQQLDVPTKSFLDHSFFKTLAFGFDGQTGIVSDPSASTAFLSYKIGTPGNPGAVPTTTTGYVKIAEIRVGVTQTTIHGEDIADRRKLMGIGGVVRASVQWRQRWNSGTPIVDVISVVAPPGVELAVKADTAAGLNEGTIYVVGGEFTKAAGSVHAQVAQNGGAKAPNVVSGFGNMYGDGAGGGVATGLVTTVQASQQTGLTAAGISAGLTQKLVQVAYQAAIAAADGTEEFEVPAAAASLGATSVSVQGEDHIGIGADTVPISYPILLPVGYVISAWTLRVNKATSSANEIFGKIRKTDDAGTQTLLSSASSSANSPGFGLLFGATGLSLPIQDGFQYFFEFLGSGGVSPSNDAIYSLNIRASRPGAGEIDDLIWNAQFDLAYH